MQEELADRPLYYVIDNLCNVLHAVTPSHVQFRSALIHAGYKVSSTHAHENGMKTDAPPSGLCFDCDILLILFTLVVLLFPVSRIFSFF